MPITTTILASGAIALASLGTVASPVTSEAPTTITSTQSVAQAPAGFSVTSHHDGQTVSSPNLRITGTAAAGSQVVLVRGLQIVASGFALEGGRFTLYQYAPLEPGTNTMKFIVRTAGVDSFVPFTLHLAGDDAVEPPVAPPAAEIPLDSVFVTSATTVNTARPTLEGLATPGATLRLNTNDGTVIGQTVVAADATWSLPVEQDLRAGRNILGLSQSLGQRTSISSVDLDYVAPAASFTINAPVRNSTVKSTDGTVRFTGTGAAGSRIVIKGQGGGRVVVDATADANGNWSGTGQYLNTNLTYTLDTVYTPAARAAQAGTVTFTTTSR